MVVHQLEWRTNFRANLFLWPDVAPNIRTLAECHGYVYDEATLLRRFPKGSTFKQPKTTRSVRNAVEALSLAGLAYRNGASANKFYLTRLGQVLFKFLGVGVEHPVINDRNRQLAAERLIAGLAVILEYRTIWNLMRQAENRLSNEELNRAMSVMKTTEDVQKAAHLIATARLKHDPALIGPRAYTGRSSADQRKVMNPWFLRAGGGRLFISLTARDQYRQLEAWAVPMVDGWIRNADLPAYHASTDARIARAMSDHAKVRG